jgi:hypothetical protein
MNTAPRSAKASLITAQTEGSNRHTVTTLPLVTIPPTVQAAVIRQLQETIDELDAKVRLSTRELHTAREAMSRGYCPNSTR